MPPREKGEGFMDYLMGIDLGTSGTKTVLFDRDGREIASATREYPLLQKQNGWAEQEPDDWWRAARESIRQVMTDSGVAPADVKGVGLSGQMLSLVLLDEENRVLRPAILWCDGRTGAECREITERVGAQRMVEITANPALVSFTAGKLLWVRRHEPELFARVRHAMLAKDYVRFRLTGEFACERSDASGTNLMDVPGGCWSQEVLRALEIDPALLPPILESADMAGRITPEAAELTGLLPGTPVAAGAADNCAAAVGTGVVAEGSAFITIGTSSVIFAQSAQVEVDPPGRLQTYCAAVPNAWALTSCALSAGLSLRWLRDQCCAEECREAARRGVGVYQVMDEQAAQSPIGSNRLIFLPYLMGERSPILDADARGAFIGLSAMHERRDMIRAVMEGVVFSLRQNMDLLRSMGVAPEKVRLCGGGARSALWRQMLADVLNLPVSTVQSEESPALGAAILAGVACGVYADVPSACALLVREGETVQPDPARHAAYEPFFRLYCAMYPALKDCFQRLQQA